ncbi:BppU family phage baseplate upper protein [Niameybacter massiliensis]|uniref:BppU family phage baseplate upper protein n=1 Tax=Niameybacter massiliensis TaxID=1658108 RepID=UPI0006B5D213|nr:BppU family phage baseplate upper protein [Niameybacter massiliensis]
MINYNIDVYLRHTEMENMYVRELIELVTNDYNGNVFNFTIYDTDKKAYDLTSKTVSLIVKSELSTVIEDNCTIVNALSGTAKITLPSDMFCEKGTYYAELQIWEGLNRITSLPFDYTVRLSLDSNEAVKADNRFNLLQQALSNVSNADAVSKEALQTANNAKTIVDDLVPKTNQAAQNAQEALDRATGVATKEELNNKIGHDGIFDETNFDFIGDKIVHDGLVSHKENQNLNGWTYLLQTQININECNFYIKSEPINIIGAGGLYILGEWSSTMTNALSIRRLGSSINIRYINISGVGAPIDNFITGLPSTTSSIEEYVYIKDNTLYIVSNGTTYSKKLPDDISKSNLYFSHVKLYGISTGNEAKGYLKYAFIYNRQLYPQDIQHNIQTISNSPSISHLETTDSSGKKSILKVSSDSEHVTMRNGYNVEEYATARMLESAKEFTSTNGEPINIPNAQDKGKVLGMSIKGRTVKNIIKRPENIFTAEAAVEVRFFKAYFEGATNGKYTLIFELENDVSKLNVSMRNNDDTQMQSSLYITSTSTKGTIEILIDVTSVKTSDGWVTFRVESTSNPVVIKNVRLLEGDLTSKNIGVVPFGLSSTQAIIDCNRLKYPIYHPTETNPDGSRKVILLGELGESKDILDYRDDGTGILSQNILFTTANSNTWTKAVETDTMISFGTALLNAKGFTNSSVAACRCEPIKVFATTAIYNATIKGIAINQNGWLYLSVLKTDLATLDSKGVNEWLTNVGFKLWYQSATPVVVQISKELMPTIGLNKTNICKVDSAVAPTEFKIVAPVDRVAELTARLEALEAKTNTQPVNTAFVEETYAKSVNKIEEVIK